MGQPGKLRVGIISAAWGARAHLPAWRSLDGVEVVAICTSRPETAQAAAGQYGIDRAFSDFRALAADPEIDIIDCGTRPSLRYHMVMAALENGKHVYNGIPFAKDLADAEAMAAARRNSGTVVAVDAFMQAVPALVHMKALVANGWAGEIFGAKIAFEAPLFTASQTNVPGYAWFADPANGASALRNLGSHMLHLLVDFFGPVASVMADQSLDLRQWPMPDDTMVIPQVSDRAALLLRFASGLPVQLDANWSMVAGEGFRFTLWGSKGRLEARAPVFPMAHDTRLAGSQDPALGSAALAPIAIPDALKTVRGSSSHGDSPETGLLPMAAIFASMRDAIAHGGDARPDFEQALHVQRVIEAAEASTRDQCRVSIIDTSSVL
ncbi:MAG: Gfo/Idh/MocA family oxidoreductase [Blastomonas sp.]